MVAFLKISGMTLVHLTLVKIKASVQKRGRVSNANADPDILVKLVRYLRKVHVRMEEW